MIHIHTKYNNAVLICQKRELCIPDCHGSTSMRFDDKIMKVITEFYDRSRKVEKTDRKS